MHEIIECPICSSKEFDTFLQLKDYSISKEPFTIIQCKKCKLKITSPRPNEEDLGKYYESEEYISHSDTSKGIINFLYQKVKSYTLKKKEKLISSFHTSKTLLDIGCGTGDFLLYCKSKNWKVNGLEPDANARKKAHEKGLENVKDSKDLFSIPEKSFGIITMWHVLEHVSELNKYLKQLYKILQDDGRILIAVPNPDSPDALKYEKYWAAYDVPRHLFHFSKSNIKELSEKHNFSLDEIKPMVFDSFYVSMLSEKHKKGSLLNASINGLISNVKAASQTNHSSLIYILSKNIQ
jgi:ubiquinone/menaquinone biosynthesis C-methylase UbiE